MPEQLRPRGVTMLDCSKNRTGFDRVLMAVAATFLTVSATSAFAQSDPARNSPAELAIDAAIPCPEPANVPPPTASDFKPDAAAPDAAKTTEAKPVEKAAETKSSNVATAPAAADASKTDTATPAAATAEKYYTTRDYAPLWTQGGTLNASGKAVIARLKDAASDGLNAADYPVPDFAAANNPDSLAEADLKLTASMLDYARQAQSGRMHYSQVSGDIQYPDHPTDPAEVLANVTAAKDASAALDSYNPPQKLYRELKAKLAELRGVGDGPVIQIAEGPTLRFTPARGKKQAPIEMEDDRVPQLRAKLGIAENADDTHYDAQVAEAVRKFQLGVELNPTGVLDDKTVKAINNPRHDRQIDTVIVNMERWRWLPRDLGVPSLGDAYVILNIPDYTLKVMRNGAQVWTTRVVTGQPGIHATPLLTETMKFITVNPTWNVPPSIIYTEYLPALQQDPTVLQRMGLKLE